MAIDESEEVHNGAQTSVSLNCSETLTLRLSTGLVTLNLSMVLTMMAGVVKKKSSRKRRMLRRTQRSHHRDPHTDRFSLSMGKMTRLSYQSSSKMNTVNILPFSDVYVLYVLTYA